MADFPYLRAYGDPPPPNVTQAKLAPDLIRGPGPSGFRLASPAPFPRLADSEASALLLSDCCERLLYFCLLPFAFCFCLLLLPFAFFLLPYFFIHPRLAGFARSTFASLCD